jgi:hypothetical protein
MHVIYTSKGMSKEFGATLSIEKYGILIITKQNLEYRVNNYATSNLTKKGIYVVARHTSLKKCTETGNKKERPLGCIRHRGMDHV